MPSSPWVRNTLGAVATGALCARHDLDVTSDNVADLGNDPARMCVWRIFGVGRDWADRPNGERSRTFAAECGPGKGDRMAVVVGEIPPHILTALTDWRAHMPLMLDAVFGGTQFGLLPPDEREAVVERQRAIVSLDDVKGSFPLWVTLELIRPIASAADYARDTARLIEDLSQFGAAASDYLSVASTRLLSALGDQLQLERLLFADARAYLLFGEGRAVTVPRGAGSAEMSLVSAEGWDALPFGAIEEVLKSLPAGKQLHDSYQKAARLLWSALEQKDDTLRRFLFAFLGLEVLANQAGGGLRERVADELSVELGGLPVRDLILPDRSDGEPPYRSVQFKFACLTTIVSRATAAQDVGIFRGLAKARNGLAHGKLEEAAELPAAECVQLLQRYVSLVAANASR